MKIYLMNGPPRSGKDTAGKMLAGMLEKSVVLKFAEPLKMATHAAFAMLLGGGQIPMGEAYDSCKDEASADFHGATPRDAYIAMSEEYVKPLLGKDFFGKQMASRIQKLSEQGYENFIITDSGFPEESLVLEDIFGTESVEVIQISRRGASYEGDSRKALPGWTRSLKNDASVGFLRLEVARMVNMILEDA